MAIEISLIYLYRVSWQSMFFLVIVTKYLFSTAYFNTEYAGVDSLPWVSHWLKPKKEQKLFISSHNSLCVQFEISARIRLNSALIVGCLRVFLAALSKVFRKASLSLILCAKLKNASWVFSVGDFVLESVFCAQRLRIFNLLFSAES